MSPALKKRLNQFSYLTSGVSRWGSLEPSFEPKLFHFHWDIFYYFRKMRPSFKKVCGHLGLLKIFQVGRYFIYFSLIYFKDIKIVRKMSKIIIKIFLGNVAKQTYFFSVHGILSESHTLLCDSKQTLMIVLRMAWVKIIKLIPPYTSESLSRGNSLPTW